MASSRSIAEGAFSTTNSTVSRRFRPAPATIVSLIWFSNVSPASSTAAIPPCAQAVDPPASSPLASTSTLCVRASVIAALSPAAPEPTIMTSCVKLVAPRYRKLVNAVRSSCFPRQIEEHILQIRLAGRNFDYLVAALLYRLHNATCVCVVFVIGNRNSARASDFRFQEAIIGKGDGI